METDFSTLKRDDGETIAYRQQPGNGPGIVFLSGFRSDMEGSKAQHLADWCARENRAFLRFDYFGHGKSSGDFTDGSIGRWADDAVFALDNLTQGPQVLVGSSMGGWIMLKLALARPDRIKAMIGLAAAPDFTEDLMWQELTETQREILMRDGQVNLANDYSDEPYLITKKLIEDGKTQLVLRTPIPFDGPVRLIQGMADKDVPWKTALSIQETVTGSDVEIQLVKGGTHRLSDPEDLDRLTETLSNVLHKVETQTP